MRWRGTASLRRQPLAGTGVDSDFLHTEKMAVVDGTGHLRVVSTGRSHPKSIMRSKMSDG